ncbi:ISSpo9 transposase [Octadecabacter antarcticus 307]|uniref:ISSpo9 transposase n=1 Tax=Octadecabacter antarcticus 307 TaxID=391626 RepID=M9RCL2_9RHOB|nr:ISSpo9 transposase [Octadecabacter antarcticus 307]
MPLRQTTGFVESLLKLLGLDWEVPDFSTLCRRQKILSVAVPYQGSKGPLHLLTPSHRCKRRLPGSGLPAHQSGGRRCPLGSMLCMRLSGNKCNARKHGGPKRRLWRKIHIPCPAGHC